MFAAKAHVERMTRYWPMVSRDTMVFNMPSNIDPLASLITAETLNDDEVLQCKKTILNIVALENRNEPLPVPAAGARGKGPKR